MVDIHDDAATLDYLRTGRLAGTATRVMSKRVLRRAWNYCLHQVPGNADCTILRRMADGTTRVVLPPNARQAITEHAHLTS